MFLDTNKKNYRSRFQQSSFRKQLQKARGYKRTPLKPPTGKLELALAKCGLKSLKLAGAAIAAVLLAGYITYAPNFFRIRTVTVLGVAPDEQAKVQALAQNYFRQHPLWPQKNILLFSPNNFSAYILNQDKNIFSVDSVKKKYFSTIIISLKPRVETYFLENQGQAAILFQDGTVEKTYFPDASSTPPANLVPIRVEQPISGLEPGKAVLDGQILSTIGALQVMATTEVSLPVAYFQLSEPNSPDITLFTPNGQQYIFDKNPDMKKLSEQLRLLLSQYSDGQKRGLLYIDMRLPDRGFVCFKDAACAQTTQILIATSTDPSLASTTPTSTQSTLKK